jgi:hypothetical protein
MIVATPNLNLRPNLKHWQTEVPGKGSHIALYIFPFYFMPVFQAGRPGPQGARTSGFDPNQTFTLTLALHVSRWCP